MPKYKSENSLFKGVLGNAEDISDAYNNIAVLQQKLTDIPENFRDFLDKFREQMQANGGIRKICEVDSSIVTQIESNHRDGLIAAVDGTDAIPPTEVSSKTVYAAGVISATAQTLNEPYVNMTCSHRTIPSFSKEEDFFEFLDTVDGFATEEQSWVVSFREHCERKEVLRLLRENPNLKIVLVDGPLYTQNLLSQSIARDTILAEMLDESNRLIGFIKNMQSSKIMHYAGMALEPGEYWTLSHWRQSLRRRFSRAFEALHWINNAPNDWVRTVYRKVNKAFAFECHPGLVEAGLALIHSPICCADVLNHEIPFLLHAADRIIQARMDARAKSENLINDSPFYVNLASERNFR